VDFGFVIVQFMQFFGKTVWVRCRAAAAGCLEEMVKQTFG